MWRIDASRSTASKSVSLGWKWLWTRNVSRPSIAKQTPLRRGLYA
jgi:hypothetical protein